VPATLAFSSCLGLAPRLALASPDFSRQFPPQPPHSPRSRWSAQTDVCQLEACTARDGANLTLGIRGSAETLASLFWGLHAFLYDIATSGGENTTDVTMMKTFSKPTGSISALRRQQCRTIRRMSSFRNRVRSVYSQTYTEVLHDRYSAQQLGQSRSSGSTETSSGSFNPSPTWHQRCDPCPLRQASAQDAQTPALQVSRRFLSIT
jgi:hypothetical protein